MKCHLLLQNKINRIILFCNNKRNNEKIKIFLAYFNKGAKGGKAVQGDIPEATVCLFLAGTCGLGSFVREGLPVL